MTQYRLCGEVGDPKTPCRFAATCALTRQDLQSSYDAPLWGMDCWAFRLKASEAEPAVAQEAAP